MKRNFIFVLILLATLSMVNAIPLEKPKNLTEFVKCEKDIGENSALLTVKLLPDPLVPGKNDTFTVSGNLSGEITQITMLFITFTADGKDIGSRSIFSNYDCFIFDQICSRSGQVCLKGGTNCGAKVSVAIAKKDFNIAIG